MKQKKVDFIDFLERFPEVKLPVFLGTDSHHDFSRKNEPLPQVMVDLFLLPFEEDGRDEFTEFVPCFRIPETYEFYAIVYWKASLMNYQYTMMTFTKKGDIIDRKVIAGTFSDGQTLTQSVAHVDEDWTINIVSGQNEVTLSEYDAATSTTNQLELLPEGTIIKI